MNGATKPFPETRLEDGLGCVSYKGPPLALESIENLLDVDISRAIATEDYLQARAMQADPAAFKAILAKTPDREPMQGDNL